MDEKRRRITLDGYADIFSGDGDVLGIRVFWLRRYWHLLVGWVTLAGSGSGQIKGDDDWALSWTRVLVGFGILHEGNGGILQYQIAAQGGDVLDIAVWLEAHHQDDCAVDVGCYCNWKVDEVVCVGNRRQTAGRGLCVGWWDYTED